MILLNVPLEKGTHLCGKTRDRLSNGDGFDLPQSLDVLSIEVGRTHMLSCGVLEHSSWVVRQLAQYIETQMQCRL